MEKLLIYSLILLVIAGCNSLALADQAGGFGAGIEESPHNFSHTSWLPISKICQICHTLHDENKPGQLYSNGLRWKKELSTVSYTMFNSDWGRAPRTLSERKNWASITGMQSHLPDGMSKLCLSCHDGIIAPNVFVLHHFVSVDYDPSRTNLRDPDTTEMGISGTISEVLDQGKVQCTSCHDVHGVESYSDTKLLRAERSKLCVTCHRHSVK